LFIVELTTRRRAQDLGSGWTFWLSVHFIFYLSQFGD